MKPNRFLVLLPALLGLACPGDWDQPLGSTLGGKIDSRLVGEWHCADPKDPKDAFTLSIVPYDSHQYVLSAATRKEAPAFLRGYTTTISGHDVMNLQVLGDQVRDGGWMYARFSVAPDGSLAVDPVRKEPLDSVSDDAESRRLAIEQLYESAELWETGHQCRPVKAAVPSRGQ